MTDLADIDYFTDADTAQNPYEYWDYLRNQGPVFQEPRYGVVAVTGYQEVQAAFKDVESFSAVNAIGGPFPPLPFTPDGDDISDQIETHRHEFPIFEHMVVMDPPEHDKGPFAIRSATHATSAEGKHRLHLAIGRPSNRRVHRQRPLRVPWRVRKALRYVGDRRSSWSSSRGSRRDPPQSGSG